jgi:hypothetical protein
MPKPFRRNIKRHTSSKLFPRKTVGGIARTELPPEKNIDSLISKASGLAQIGALALAVFGYFYTVLPVFQNQKLQEDNARLQLQNEAAEKKNTSILAQQKELARRTAQMKAELDEQKQTLSVATQNAIDARAHELRALSMASAATSQVKAQYSELDKANWKLAIIHLTTRVSFAEIDAFSKSSGSLYADGDDSSFIRSLGKLWPSPLNIFIEGSTVASKDTLSVPPQYSQRLRDYIEKHKDQLQCEKPDTIEMADNYDKERSAALDGLEKQAKDEIERQSVEAKNRGRELVVNSEELSRMEAVYKINDILSLRKKYRDLLLKEQDSCAKVINQFFGQLQRDMRVESL